MTGQYRLRVAYLLATRGAAVAAVLLLVGVAAGGAAGYTYVNQANPTTTVSEHTHVQTVDLDVADSAVVTGDTPLWSAGTRLTDHPTYFAGSMPRLTVTSRVSTPADTEVTLRQRTTLVVTANADGDAVWTDRWPVASRNATVADGSWRTRTTVDVSRVMGRIDRLRSEVDAPVTFSVRLEVRTRYDTGRYTGALSTSAPLSLGGQTYSVGTFESAGRTHQERISRRVDRPDPGVPARTLGAGAAAVLAFAGAVVAGVTWRRVDDADRLRYRLDRAHLDSWISAGEVPADAGTRTVSVSSLADLVDVAIDSNRRVVHDERLGVYAVFDGETAYVYRPPAEPDA